MDNFHEPADSDDCYEVPKEEVPQTKSSGELEIPNEDLMNETMLAQVLRPFDFQN
jgi:hypothetical protein